MYAVLGDPPKLWRKKKRNGKQNEDFPHHHHHLHSVHFIHTQNIITTITIITIIIIITTIHFIIILINLQTNPNQTPINNPTAMSAAKSRKTTASTTSASKKNGKAATTNGPSDAAKEKQLQEAQSQLDELKKTRDFFLQQRVLKFPVGVKMALWMVVLI